MVSTGLQHRGLGFESSGLPPADGGARAGGGGTGRRRRRHSGFNLMAAQRRENGETEAERAGLARGWDGLGPAKVQELKSFFAEVRASSKKVTWPSGAK